MKRSFVCDGIEWTSVRALGKGSFGEAHLIHMANAPQSLAVCKLVHLAVMKKEERQEALNEVRVLSQLKHPNIVEYIGSFESGGYLHILMEYCDGGDLEQLVKKQGGVHIEENMLASIFIQTCSAIRYLHERRILHRDLKAQNIFLTHSSSKSGGNDSGKHLVVKLGDFGISTVLRNTLALAKTVCGTPYYFSPELCLNRPYNNKSDIWSLGCILYEMATLKHAFDANNMKALMQRILTGKYLPIPNSYHRSLQELVDGMLQQKVERRFSIQQVLKSAFVAQHTERLFLAHELETSNKRSERQLAADRQQNVDAVSGQSEHSPRRQGSNVRDQRFKQAMQRRQQQEQDDISKRQALVDQRRRKNLRAAQNYDRHREQIQTKISELERLDDVRRRIEICSYEDQQKYVQQGWQVIQDKELRQDQRVKQHEERDKQLQILMEQMKHIDEKMQSRRLRRERAQDPSVVPEEFAPLENPRLFREPSARELAQAYKNRVSAEAPWNRNREVPVGFTKESWEAHCRIMGYGTEGAKQANQQQRQVAALPVRPSPAAKQDESSRLPPVRGELTDNDVSVLLKVEKNRLETDPAYVEQVQQQREEQKRNAAVLEWEAHKLRIRQAEALEARNDHIQLGERPPLQPATRSPQVVISPEQCHPPALGYRIENPRHRFAAEAPVRPVNIVPYSSHELQAESDSDELDSSDMDSDASSVLDYGDVIHQIRLQNNANIDIPDVFEEAQLPANEISRVGNMAKFTLDGKTLHLQGVTSTSAPAARVEALRVYLMDALGGQRSLDRLITALQEIQSADVDESLADAMLAKLEQQYGQKANLVDLAIQLIVCESMLSCD